MIFFNEVLSFSENTIFGGKIYIISCENEIYLSILSIRAPVYSKQVHRFLKELLE